MKLKNCPLCGNKPEVESVLLFKCKNKKGYMIICEQFDHVVEVTGLTLKEVSKVWNKRSK